MKRVEQIIVHDVINLMERRREVSPLLIEDFRLELEAEGVRVRKKLGEALNKLTSEELHRFIQDQHDHLRALASQLIAQAARAGQLFEHLYYFLTGLMDEVWMLRLRVLVQQEMENFVPVQPKNEKLDLNITVAEAAAFVYGYNDPTFILDDNITKFGRIFNSTFTTVKSLDVSVSYFRKKYQNIEPAVARKVIGFHKAAIKRLEKFL